MADLKARGRFKSVRGAAIQLLGNPSGADIRRLQEKWKNQGAQLVAEAWNRRERERAAHRALCALPPNTLLGLRPLLESAAGFGRMVDNALEMHRLMNEALQRAQALELEAQLRALSLSEIHRQLEQTQRLAESTALWRRFGF